MIQRARPAAGQLSPDASRTDTSAATQAPPSATAEPAPRPTLSRVDMAEQLADQGHLTEAEMLFARAAASTTDLDAMTRFGHFLSRLGQLDRAQAQYSAVLDLAQASGGEVWEAKATGNLGLIEGTRGNLD